MGMDIRLCSSFCSCQEISELISDVGTLWPYFIHHNGSRRFSLELLHAQRWNLMAILARSSSRMFAFTIFGFCMVSHQLASYTEKFHLLDIIHKRSLRMSEWFLAQKSWHRGSSNSGHCPMLIWLLGQLYLEKLFWPTYNILQNIIIAWETPSSSNARLLNFTCHSFKEV